MDSYRNRTNMEAERTAGRSPVSDVYNLERASELIRVAGTAGTAEIPGIAALLGHDLLGASGQQIGVISDLLVQPDTGQVLYALVDLVETGEHQPRKRFMLPVSCIDGASNRLRCPFERKHFEYGPQWRDNEGLFRLERHHAYWTGLVPDSGSRHPQQNGTSSGRPTDRPEKE